MQVFNLSMFISAMAAFLTYHIVASTILGIISHRRHKKLSKELEAIWSSIEVKEIDLPVKDKGTKEYKH